MKNNAVVNPKLDFWVKSSSNVLFIGKHGVGKTAMVKDAFERNGLKYKYFSASTMDPWVDFIGVPREKVEDKAPEDFQIIKELARVSQGVAVEWVMSNWKMPAEQATAIVTHAINRKEGATFLELVKPQCFANDEIEALFFDEFNRSPKKVRNAVMELIQFKSINGVKFPNLKVVWAAVNPEDDEETYDVEKLDPAQKDRFHVHVNVPYEPNAEWFRAKFGKKTADAALEWWNDLPDEAKNLVSPRRLEYALATWQQKDIGGDIRDVLPPEGTNVTKLINSLGNGPISEHIENLMKQKNSEAARVFMSNENNYASAMKLIPKSETLMEFFLPVLEKEKISLLMAEDEKICDYILKNCGTVQAFCSVCRDIQEANTNGKIVKKIRKLLSEDEKLREAMMELELSAPSRKETSSLQDNKFDK
jgi:MoxR-like ATPase